MYKSTYRKEVYSFLHGTVIFDQLFHISSGVLSTDIIANKHIMTISVMSGNLLCSFIEPVVEIIRKRKS